MSAACTGPSTRRPTAAWLAGVLPGRRPSRASRSTSRETVLGLALVAGTTAFVWAPPCMSIRTGGAVRIRRVPRSRSARVRQRQRRALPAATAQRRGAPASCNPSHGRRRAALMLVASALARRGARPQRPDGPTHRAVVLALLGNFVLLQDGPPQTALKQQSGGTARSCRWRRSGTRGALSSSAANTFGGQLLAAAAVPLLLLLEDEPAAARGCSTPSAAARWGFVAVFRRRRPSQPWPGQATCGSHLMLYRVFSPRFMMAASLLLVVDLAGILIALTGTRAQHVACRRGHLGGPTDMWEGELVLNVCMLLRRTGARRSSCCAMSSGVYVKL